MLEKLEELHSLSMQMEELIHEMEERHDDDELTDLEISIEQLTYDIQEKIEKVQRRQI